MLSCATPKISQRPGIGVELMYLGRVRTSVVIGGMTALLGLIVAATPSLSSLEDSLGLRALFFLRGDLAPPSGVAVVSIDEGTAIRLKLPLRLRDWPRSIHGQLVDRLVERGATALAFDLEFLRHSADPLEDRRFAAAVARAARVVLVQRFGMRQADTREIWERHNPVPVLADAALALAPVPVPDAPLVTSFWTFLEAPPGHEVPTLPAVMLQIAMRPLLPDVARLLHDTDPANSGFLSRAVAVDRTGGLLVTMHALRRASIQSSGRRLAALLESSVMPETKRRGIGALVRLYAGAPMALLNYYGPPGTICTIPYEDVLAGGPNADASCSLLGRAVFVGAGPARLAGADQADTYHTIYSSTDGSDLSGVEIHATAFANLITGRILRPLPPALHAAVLIVAGFAFGGAVFLSRTARRRHRWISPRILASVVTCVLAFAYLITSYHWFARLDSVWPLAIPLLVQLPVALVVSLVLSAPPRAETVRCVCLLTDAHGSTPLSERLRAFVYGRLMRSYHDALSRPVGTRRGEALSPSGDGRLYIWRASGTPAEERHVRLQACLAALEIFETAERFNALDPEHHLPTRIGLDLGVVTVSSDADRGTYAVDGYAANLAKRLQEANRTHNSSVLASESVVAGLEDSLVLRRIEGGVVLKGIASAPIVYEIVGRRAEAAIPRSTQGSPAGTL
jgi:adenylate cyclase